MAETKKYLDYGGLEHLVEKAEAAIGDKQDKLTAGTGITIVGDVISSDVDFSEYDKKADRVALIEEGEDEAYVTKMVDSENNLLLGFKESGEMDVPSGLPDDAYSLINALYRKLLDVFPTIRDYADRTYEAAAVRKALIDDAEDEKYVLKMEDAEGSLLQGFDGNGEVEIPSGLSDDAYSLIYAVYNKMCDIASILADLKERVDSLD